MAWRIVKQPNGLYSRFSDVVDNFTDIDMTRDEAYNLCREHLSAEDAEGKIRRADNTPERYQESLDIIKAVHGESFNGRKQ